VRIKIYMTEGSEGSSGGSITLLIPEAHHGDLPKHPEDGKWSYLASIETDGEKSVRLTRTALRALELQGFYMRRMSEDDG
jgi:hypothetical protein